jgi:hypothetical protein
MAMGRDFVTDCGAFGVSALARIRWRWKWSLLSNSTYAEDDFWIVN